MTSVHDHGTCEAARAWRRPPASFALLAPLALLAACAGRQTAVPHRSGDGHPLQVAFVVVDGVYDTELTAPFDIFHHTIFHTDPGMRVFTVGHRADRPVTSFEGLRLLPDHGFADAPPADVLVVASAEHSMDSDLHDPDLMDYVRRAGERADWIVSLCDGAFVLAQAGLLDGLQCTTFPADVDRMRQQFPQLDVLEGVSFVHDGRAITSAGGARSFDAALYLAEVLYGVEAAQGLAEGLVIDWDLSEVPHHVAGTARGPDA